MTRTCYLHIGLPKTGTSSIQQSLHNYADDRIEYARFTEPNHSPALLYAFARKTDRLLLPERFRARAESENQNNIAKTMAQFERVTDGTRDVILSGEYFSGRLSKTDLEAMRDALLHKFDRVKVICYLRPYLESIGSAFQQMVKAGRRELIVPTDLYRPRIENVMDVFGSAAMEFCLFDRAVFPGGDIVNDFCRRVGIDESAVPRKQVNESLSLEATAVIMAHNAFELASPSEKARLDGLRSLRRGLVNFGKLKVGFSKRRQKEGLAASAKDIAWAEKISGFSLKGKHPQVEVPIDSQEQLLALAAQHASAARDFIRQSRKETLPADPG